jgi:uncharacterized protein
MRLTNNEIKAIKTAVYQYDKTAKIYLFGSRTDDSKLGGDIDLLVISNKITNMDKIKIKLKIYDEIGEQKIDLLVAKNNNLDDPFIKLIIIEGILL